MPLLVTPLVVTPLFPSLVFRELFQKLETVQLFSELFFSPISFTFGLDGENTRFNQLSPQFR